MAIADINLKLIHILGRHNIMADSLSRYYINDQCKKKVEQLLPQATWVVSSDSTLFIDFDI